MANALSKPMVGGGNTPLLNNTRVETVVKCVTELVTALELLGFESEGYKPHGTIEWHTRCVVAMKGDWMGFYKYKLAAWVASQLDQELPPRPELLPQDDDAKVLLGGRAMMWLNLLKRTRPKRFSQVVATLMTVKRSMQRPDEKKQKQALLEAFKALTRDIDPTASSPEDEEFKADLRRVVRQIFEGKEFTWRDCLEPFFPSTNANYLTTRSAGGAVGHIMESGILDGLDAPKRKLIKEIEEENGKFHGGEIDDSAVTERFRQLYERIIEGAETEEKKVTLVALAEALKVRVISKGPVLTYTALKPLQRWMWKTLKDHKSGVFKLVGEEISTDYLERQIRELRPGEKFLSGDYKAATDNLKPWVSETITNEISKYIEDRRLSRLFTQALTGHLIGDPENPGHFKMQTWGQLMGSIVSFPVLCIANATICLRSREVTTQRGLTLYTARIAVNGDDLIMRADINGKRKWERDAAQSGMAPSIGKCFFSEEFLNMNSAQILVEEPTCDPNEKFKDKPVVHFLEMVKAINLGLVAGLGRSTSGKLEKVRVANWRSINSVSSNAHTLIEGCAEEDKLRVFKAYLNRNWEMLTGGGKTKKGKERPKVALPWFLPQHLGGLGLPMFPHHWVKNPDGTQRRPYMPTKIDLRLAACFHAQGELPSLRPEGVSWKVWDYAQKRAKDFKTEGIVIKITDENNQIVGHEKADYEKEIVNESFLMGRLCVEAIFTQPFKLIYEEKAEQNKTLRKVEDAVRKILRNTELMKNTEPFTEGTLALPEEKLPERVWQRLTTLSYAQSIHFTQ